jgi:hypothetical protein
MINKLTFSIRCRWILLIPTLWRTKPHNEAFKTMKLTRKLEVELGEPNFEEELTPLQNLTTLVLSTLHLLLLSR